MEKQESGKEKVLRYLYGSYNKSEIEEIINYIRDPDTQPAIDEISLGIWKECIDRPLSSDPTKHEQYKQEARRLLRKIDGRKRSSIRWIWSAAASVILLLSIGVTAWEFKTANKHRLYTEISTSFGEKKEYILPDGSRVLLNACSKLKFPEKFSGEYRNVELSGEAYFEVARNEKSTFRIEAGAFKIKVLGTEFDIKAYTKQETASVSVKSGKVEVELPEASLKLTANEQVRVLAGGNEFIKSKEDHTQALAWIHDHLYYRNATIYDITKDLERHYNCRFRFAGNQSFPNLFSGRHDNRSLEAVLQSIEYATGIKYKIEGDTVWLYK